MMKTTIFRYLLLLALLMVASSCDKWLGEEPKGQIILKTAEEYSQLFDHTSAFRYTTNDISYLDDELWINTQVLINGWNSMNLTVANIIYKEDYDRAENAQGNAGNGSTIYQTTYSNITKVANTILYEMPNIVGNELEKKHLTAQAKMLRAFSYFMLVNVYAKPYDALTADKDGAIPIRTDHFIETKPNPAKSTIAAVYAQIEKDLEAIEDLPEKTTTPYRFNKAAGYAFKAKVHLFKKEFEECLKAAKASNALASHTYNLPEIINPVTHKPNSPIYATGEENLYFSTTTTTYFLIHQSLIDLYKGGLQAYGLGSEVKDVRLDLHQRPSASIKDYMFTMQYIPNTKDYSANSVGLRTTEVMLMMAECYARAGQFGEMKEALKPYLESRYRNYVHADFVVPNNKVAAVKVVLEERRKELTMGCNRFFDLRRLNTESEYQVIPTRTIPGDVSVTPGIVQDTYSLKVKSPLYILPFPTKVILNDPRLESNTW